MPAPASRRRPLPALLALLATVVAAAVILGDDVATPPARDTARAARRAPDTLTTAQRLQRAAQDSADRRQADSLAREWLAGPQRWVATHAEDSVVDLADVKLEDSTAADVLAAFTTLRALRESAGTIELLGAAAPARAVLAAGVDSLVREAAWDYMTGCPVGLHLPMRGAGGGWSLGVVPGMVAFVAPADTGSAPFLAEGLRLLAATGDSVLSDTLFDAPRRAAWMRPRVLVWREDELEILVASRAAASPAPEGWEQEQTVVGERRAGSDAPFTAAAAWHGAWDGDSRSSVAVEGAVRVGPARRFALLLGTVGKEGSGGSLLVRARGAWRDAVSWYSGC